jgi:hypothetical protein
VAKQCGFQARSKGEWLSILWLKVVSTTARDGVPAAQLKRENVSVGCARQKGEMDGDFRRFLRMLCETNSAIG